MAEQTDPVVTVEPTEWTIECGDQFVGRVLLVRLPELRYIARLWLGTPHDYARVGTSDTLEAAVAVLVGAWKERQ